MYMVGHCLNSSFNPFMEDFTGKSCLDYATPFKDINGQNIRDLITTAQEQWRTQLSEAQVEERMARPTSFADVFQPYREDMEQIHKSAADQQMTAAATTTIED